MVILHCMKECEWNKRRYKKFYGEQYIESCGFIDCSEIGVVHDIAWRFLDIPDPLIFLCIDTNKVHPEIKWDNDGRADSPRIYGPLNTDSVIDVLPFLKDKNNNFILNRELGQYIGHKL